VQTTVAVGPDQLWVEDSGGSGPVVALMHAGIADSRMWDPLWPELAGACRVIRYDVRGYGRSPAATHEYTLAGDLRAVLDQLQVPSAHLVGCSMGGATAVDLALAEPGRARSLVLLCPGVSGYPWPADPEVDAESEALTKAGDEEGLVRLALREYGRAGPDDPLAVDLMRAAARAWPNEQRYQREGKPAFGRLSELRVPTVIMVGDRDRPMLIACDEEMAKRIPGCTLIRMPGVDHLPTLRAPELVAQTILERVREVPA
jgi:3-oxoadipate enol-lactonase